MRAFFLFWSGVPIRGVGCYNPAMLPSVWRENSMRGML